MPNALIPLEKLQFGIEATHGTAVAATKIYLAENGGSFQPENEMVAIEETRGVMAITEDISVRKGSTLSATSALDFQHSLLPLLTSIKKVTATGVGPYVWTFPMSVTAAEDVASATFEVKLTDGTTAFFEREFAYAQCSRWAIDLAFNQPAKITADFFGRASTASTLTPALAPYTREIVRSNQFNLFIDPTWATLGTTEVSGLVRSANLEFISGIEPQYGIESRSELDYATTMRGMPMVKLTYNGVVGATFATEYAAFEANTLRFIRLYAAGSGSQVIQFDIAGRYTSVSLGEDGNMRTGEFTFEGRYDPTSAKVFEAMVTNSVATV